MLFRTAVVCKDRGGGGISKVDIEYALILKLLKCLGQLPSAPDVEWECSFQPS